MIGVLHFDFIIALLLKFFHGNPVLDFEKFEKITPMVIKNVE
jgi:hypothetical protein